MKTKFLLSANLILISFCLIAHAQPEEDPSSQSSQLLQSAGAPIVDLAPIVIEQEAPPLNPNGSEEATQDTKNSTIPSEPQVYTIGIDDILSISLLQPDQLTTVVTVSADGSISFPYIGIIKVKGMTLQEIQEEIQNRLADGYMNYPVVIVTLQESRSRKFFVYGEVTKPGTYPIEENTTVLRAISMAGGFTKFGSSSRVKILKPRKDGKGYNPIKINLKALMDGEAEADIALESGDIVVISEGIF